MSSHDSNLPRFDAHPQRHNALGGFAWKAGLLLTAAVVSEGAMLFERRHQPDSPRMDVRGNLDDLLIMAQFGVNTNDVENAEQFTSHFKHLGKVACTVHSKAGIQIDKVYAEMLKTRTAHPDAKVDMYGHSLGGLSNAVIAAKPDFAQKFGPVRNFIMENSFASYKAIKPEGKMLLGSSHFGPISWAAGHFIPSAKAPSYQVAEMDNFARRSKLKQGSLEGIAEAAFCIQAEDDPFVYNDEAFKSIQWLFGDQPVTRVIDNDYRPKRSHPGATQYPEVTTQVIEGTYIPELGSLNPAA